MENIPICREKAGERVVVSKTVVGLRVYRGFVTPSPPLETWDSA